MFIFYFIVSVVLMNDLSINKPLVLFFFLNITKITSKNNLDRTHHSNSYITKGTLTDFSIPRASIPTLHSSPSSNGHSPFSTNPSAYPPTLNVTNPSIYTTLFSHFLQQLFLPHLPLSCNPIFVHFFPFRDLHPITPHTSSQKQQP